MKKPLFSVLLLALTMVGQVSTVATATTNSGVALEQSKRKSFQTEYERGVRLGGEDARAVKCSNPAGFEQWYYETRQMALDYSYDSNPEFAQFWSGYYTGLESGYYSQVYCGGSGGPGGPGGPIGNPPVNDN